MYKPVKVGLRYAVVKNADVSLHTSSSRKGRVKLSYLPAPPLEQDMTQGQFFKRSLTGLNSEFSFS